MAKRGPKIRTASNSYPKAPSAGFWDGFREPSAFKPAESAEFNRLVANLRRAGTLDRTDPQVVVSAARVQVMLDEAYAKIADEGLTTTGGHGSPIPHPLIGVVNMMTIRLRGLMHDMGLTAPSSRHGVPEKTENPEDGWGDLLSVRA